MTVSSVIKPDREFSRTLREAGANDLKRCYQCATCSAVCELTVDDRPFPRKEMLYAQWGLKDRLLSSPDIWLCFECNDCSERCPRNARPGDMMAAARRYAFQHFAFPQFLGKAVASPSGLLPLLFFPVFIIAALAVITRYVSSEALAFGFSGHVDFGAFILHGFIEGLFITGNVIIFAFAAVGLLRFYTGLSASHGENSSSGFMAALTRTVLEIITHDRFGYCKASHFRQFAHILVIFGFVGAMVTAGLALAGMVFFDFNPPIPMSHPIKWLGNASGLAMIIGLVIIILQRLNSREIMGKTHYTQWMFIWSVFGVAFTGMLIQFLRIAELPILAYSFYFIHLVMVFFILWYAPYSQFGHMFYRTLAMVYARSIGRLPRLQEKT